jgi:hypothetical protein
VRKRAIQKSYNQHLKQGKIIMRCIQAGATAEQVPASMASFYIFVGHCQRLFKYSANKLIFLILAITLFHTGIAFGAGERFLGVQVAEHPQGVIIQQVVQGSPATRVIDISTGQYMSLKPFDIIQFVNGVKVSSPEHFVQLIRTGPPVIRIRVIDVHNRIFRELSAGVGPSDEIKAYFNQRNPSFQGNGNSYMPPAPAGTSNPQGMSAEQRNARIQMLQTQINILDRKIRDQERSVRLYEEWGDKRPGATNMMLQQSARNLLDTYERQKMDLEMQKSRIESGM